MGAEHLSEVVPLRVSALLLSPGDPSDSSLGHTPVTPSGGSAGVDGEGTLGAAHISAPPVGEKAARTEPARQPPCHPVTPAAMDR